MKKLITVLLLLILVALPARADDTSLLTSIYQKVYDDYVEPITIEEFAVSALKSISVMDDRVKIADDKERLTIYAYGKAVKTLYKPEDVNDIKAWVQLTQNVIKEAVKSSPKLERQDFAIIDAIMVEAFQNLAHDSVYYSDFDQVKRSSEKTKRYYSDRVEDNVLIIKLGSFNRYTKDNLEKSLKTNPEIKAVILDLRGNQGGMLSEAVAIINMFLDDGIIGSTRGRSADSTKYYMAEAGDVLNNKPMVVLVDGNTASSAELMAAAFQDQGRAVLLGTSTFGKGTVQGLITLENESQLALTNAYFFTPAGKKIDKVGITPDICTFEKDGMDNVERIISKSSEACSKEDRENSNIDIEAAIALINKNL